jgi:pleiotropic regulator 1
MEANSNEFLSSLFARSKKRTFDLFSVEGGHFQHDSESLKAKLSSKINDEYFHVKTLPPPAKGTAAPKSTAPSKAVTGQLPPPSMISKGKLEQEDDKATNPSDDTTMQNFIKSIPQSQDKDNFALMEYQPLKHEKVHAPAQTKALALQNPYANQKPEWHAPWKLSRVISGHTGWVQSVAFDPSNQWFATGSADRTIKIWELASGKLKLTLTGHIGSIRSLVVDPRHPYLYSAGEDKQIKCWDLETNKVIRQYHGHLSGAYTMSLHPILDFLVTGGRDSTVRVWDARTKVAAHVLGGHSNTVHCVGTQASEPQIVSGSADTTIRLWDMVKGASVATLTHHKKGIRSLLMHPTEYSMASGGSDNLKIWGFPEGKFLRNLSGQKTIIHSLAVNHENVLASAGDNGSLYFWDWKTGYNFQQIQTQVQPGSLEAEGGVFAVAFDVTGSRLVTADCDKSIKIYKEDPEATPESHPIDEDWKNSLYTRKY